MDMFTIVGIGLPILALAPVVKMTLGSARERSGKKRGIQHFPRVAAQLGLTFTPSRDFDEVGEIEGTYRGYEVRLRPDFFGSVKVGTRGRFPLELDTNAPSQRPEPGMVAFVTGRAGFDRDFSQRYASSAVAERLAGSPWLTERLAALCSKWRSRLDNVKIDEYGVTAFMQDAHAYDADAAAALMNELVEIAAGLDQALAGCQLDDD